MVSFLALLPISYNNTGYNNHECRIINKNNRDDRAKFGTNQLEQVDT